MFLSSVFVPSSVDPAGRTRDVGVAAQRALLHVAVGDADRPQRVRAAARGTRRACSGERRSGSVTISTSGVPQRLKSTSETSAPAIRPPAPPACTTCRRPPRGGRGRCRPGSPSTSRWPCPQIGSSYWLIWYALGLSGIEVVLAVELRPARRSRSPGPARSRSPSRRPPALITGSTPGMAQADRADARVRLVAEAVRAARRTSWSGVQLDVDLEADHRLPRVPLMPAPPARGRHADRTRSPARARARPSRIRFSANAGPISCRPTGSPSESPQGIEMPGQPARLTGTVSTSHTYIASGSSTLSPIGNATVGDVGVAIRSTVVERRVEVAPDQRAHLLRLAVVGVVVAGRQRVGAEHDPPLDLGAEARRAGAPVHLDDRVARRLEPQAVAHAVVAGQVGRRLGGRDQVVGRQPVAARAAARPRRSSAPSDARMLAGPRRTTRARPARCPAPAGRSGTPMRTPRRSLGVRDPRPARAAAPTSSRSGSCPAITWSASAASRTVRANGPIWSSDDANAIRPYRDTRRTSASARRRRTAPPAGGSTRRCRCRARAARTPRRPPPPTRRSSRRARARGPTGCGSTPNAEFSVDEPIANSSMLVLPIGTSPAAFARVHAAGVVRRAVSLEDPRAGGGLLAARAEVVLERDRHALQPRAALARPAASASASAVRGADAQERVQRRRPAARSGRGRPRPAHGSDTSRASSSSTQRSAVRPSVSIIPAPPRRRHPEVPSCTAGAPASTSSRGQDGRGSSGRVRSPSAAHAPSAARRRGRAHASASTWPRIADSCSAIRLDLVVGSASAGPAGQRAGRPRR